MSDSKVPSQGVELQIMIFPNALSSNREFENGARNRPVHTIKSVFVPVNGVLFYILLFISIVTHDFKEG